MSGKNTTCEFCGAVNSADEAYCRKCGAPLFSDDTVLSKTVSLEPEPTPEPEPPKQKTEAELKSQAAAAQAAQTELQRLLETLAAASAKKNDGNTDTPKSTPKPEETSSGYKLKKPTVSSARPQGSGSTTKSDSAAKSTTVDKPKSSDVSTKTAEATKTGKSKKTKKRRENIFEVLRNEVTKIKGERERFFYALRNIAFCMPAILAIFIGLDIFRDGRGHLDEIYASSTPSLGPIITLYVISAAAALFTAIFFNITMYINSRDYGYTETYHIVTAILCATISVGLCAVNGVMSWVRDGQYQVKYIFCDRFDYEYVEKSEEITLPHTEIPDIRDAGDHYEQYYFNGWQIDGGVYPRGARFKVDGDTDVVALDGYKMFGKVTWTATNSWVSLSYFDGKNTVYPQKGDLVPFDVELTIAVRFDYDYDNDFYINGVSIYGTKHVMTVNGNIDIRAYSEQPPMCLVEGTQVMLADGSTKPVEELAVGDMLTAFDHEKGEYCAAPLLVNVHAGEAARECEVVGLEFDDGKRLDFVYEHALFDLTINRYVYITAENAREFVGHSFAARQGAAVLTNASAARRTVRVYNPATVWHINVIANGMLTMSAGMTNLFEYGEGMKYDEQKMHGDIAAHGLYEYADFADYVTPEVFEAFPFKYYKPAVEKGEFTFEKLLWLIEFYNRS